MADAAPLLLVLVGILVLAIAGLIAWIYILKNKIAEIRHTVLKLEGDPKEKMREKEDHLGM